MRVPPPYFDPEEFPQAPESALSAPQSAEAPTRPRPPEMSRRPSAEEVLRLLAELELQYHSAGTITREEFLARKEELLARIREREKA